MIRLTLPPPLNAMYRAAWSGKGVRKTDECKDWETDTQITCRTLGIRMIPGNVRIRMTIDLYYGSHERDIDSSLKATLDCLQGVVYENDRQIVELLIRKYQDKLAPRLEIDIFESK